MVRKYYRQADTVWYNHSIRKADAKMIKTFHVTQEDIDKGRRNTLDACPVYRAIRRELKPSIHNLKIGIYAITFEATNDIPRVRYKTPGNVADFILEFDNKGKNAVKPFDFKLNIRKEYLK